MTEDRRQTKKSAYTIDTSEALLYSDTLLRVVNCSVIFVIDWLTVLYKMSDTVETEKYKLKQALEMIQPVLMSKLQKAKPFMKEGDLEALHRLAEGKGTCYYKFSNNEWISSIPLESNENLNIFLCTLLAFIWQTHELKQISYDPIDLRIARSKRRIHEEENINERGNEIEETGNEIEKRGNEENSGDDSEEDEEALSEDGINYLIGPYEIDLGREDTYHSLFATHRKSCERRQRNFLNSKHLPKARKLSGVDIWRYGYKFNKAVLEKAAASLEELNIEDLDVKFIDVLENAYMPKLRRLNLWLRKVDEENDRPPFIFPSPKEGHIGLRYLRAHVPRPALESLLSSNAKTLLEVHLKVGTAHSNWDRWPNSCRDLDKLLECCKGTLRRLVLIRDSYAHTRASCKDQVEALKQNLPGLNVTCEYCCPK
ncbi:uncharacterized protein LOC113211033 [Frankliniella occidentalis]|uniref:Uncharacterized protein LOC113211033 n=1 Tax=Frankliniella occidentalis TaxID=133901 RepID=A0A6J1SVZ7_FRAOC|nr:uncharacterized protein LOC113211033 [Frankliniella occidentalis]